MPYIFFVGAIALISIIKGYLLAVLYLSPHYILLCKSPVINSTVFRVSHGIIANFYLAKLESIIHFEFKLSGTFCCICSILGCIQICFDSFVLAIVIYVESFSCKSSFLYGLAVFLCNYLYSFGQYNVAILIQSIVVKLEGTGFLGIK